ncbi:MAG: hypothetical protein NDI80_07945 [Flavobacteriaceae bacterium]|nr:hypothetical protein [Flavobacteriaceae bacterium]
MKVKYKILIFLFLSFHFTFAQCAMCKASLEAGIKSGGIEAGGINNGILYLMFIPYLLIAAVGFFMYKHFKS